MESRATSHSQSQSLSLNSSRNNATIDTYPEFGGDMVSTWVTKPSEHVEVAEYLVNKAANFTVANDDNYSLAA